MFWSETTASIVAGHYSVRLFAILKKTLMNCRFVSIDEIKVASLKELKVRLINVLYIIGTDLRLSINNVGNK